MYLPDFDYYAPPTLGEACRLLTELGPSAKVLAGGTDLLHKMKTGSVAPAALVSLRKLRELREIRYDVGRGVVIGALATQNDILESLVLHGRYLSVSQAAHQMSSHQIRNLGTVGGNIVNAVPSADLPPILIALQSTVRLVSPRGERTLALEEFFVEPASSVIAPDEILTEVVIPDQATTGSAYVKFGLRRSGALAVVGAAAAVTVAGNRLREARIVLSSSAPVVFRAREAEAFVAGREVSDALFSEAGRLAAGASRARDSIRGSADYRRHLAGVLTKRALRRAITEGHA